jgi:hypothetical protein
MADNHYQSEDRVLLNVRIRVPHDQVQIGSGNDA